MYCMAMKKKPKLAKNRKVMPDRAGGEVRPHEQPYIEQRMPASQFDDHEHQRPVPHPPSCIPIRRGESTREQEPPPRRTRKPRRRRR